MKNSDSKNSLAELNPAEPICFVCLEESSPEFPLVSSSLLRSCGCKFHTHADCWNTWRKDKSDFDCPYCGKRTLHMSLPMTAPFQQTHYPGIDLPPTRERKIFFIGFLCSLFLTAVTVITYKIVHPD